MNPILLELGPFNITYYGTLMALAFIFGAFIAIKLAKERNLDKDIILDFLVYLIISVILGARLFHVFVYNSNYFLNHPLEILFVWKGGLASHGALIGAIIAIYLFCRKRNIQFYDLADVLAIPAALGASFIRLGNFINGELVGRITSVPWAVHFEGYEGLRHPSQLYEAGKNLALFFILLNLRKVRHLPKGVIFWGFVGLYSVFRFLVEFYKDFPLHYGLTIGQIISMPFIALAAIMLFYIWKKHEPS